MPHKQSKNSNRKDINFVENNQTETTDANYVATMPATSLIPVVLPYLKVREQIAGFPTLSKQIHLLFTNKISLNYLLDLVVNYKLTEKEFNKLNEAKPQSPDLTNPILRIIDKVLKQVPAYALKQADVNDGKKCLHTCALEYAFKTRNIALWDLLVKHIQHSPSEIDAAAKLITKLDQERMQYHLKLLAQIGIDDKVEDRLPIHRIMIFDSVKEIPLVIPNDAVGLVQKNNQILIYKMLNNRTRLDKTIDANFNFGNQKEITSESNANLFKQIKLHLDYLPELSYEPTLIKLFDKDGNLKFYIWGELNGEWLLTSLSAEDYPYVEELKFPNPNNAAITIKPTEKLYQVLKKGHSEGYFDLEEYVRLTEAFLEKYPPNVSVPDDQCGQCNADAFEIGRAQSRFPKWLAQLWCSKIPFAPIPDFNNELQKIDHYSLKENGGVDFYHPELGSSLMIAAMWHGRWVEYWAYGITYDPRMRPDVAAMSSLSKLITNKFENINKLLLDLGDRHPSSPLSFSNQG